MPESNQVLDLSREALIVPNGTAYLNNELKANENGFVTARDFIEWLKNMGVFTSISYKQNRVIEEENVAPRTVVEEIWQKNYAFGTINRLHNGYQGLKSNDFITLSTLRYLGCFDMTKAMYYHVRDNMTYLEEVMKLNATELDVFLNFHLLKYDEEGLPFKYYVPELAGQETDNKFEEFANTVFITKSTILKSLCTHQHTRATYVVKDIQNNDKVLSDGRKWIQIIAVGEQLANIDWDLEKYPDITVETPLQQEFLECKKNLSNLDYVPTGNERFLSGYMMKKLYPNYNTYNTAIHMQVTDADFAKMGANNIKISDEPVMYSNSIHLKLGFYSSTTEVGIFQSCPLYSIEGGLYPRTFTNSPNINWTAYNHSNTAFSYLQQLFKSCIYLNRVSDDIFNIPVNKDGYIPAMHDFKKAQVIDAKSVFEECKRLNYVKTSIFDGCYNIKEFGYCFSSVGANMPIRNLTIDFTRLMHNKRNCISVFALFYKASGVNYEITRDVFEFCRTKLENAAYCFFNSGWTLPQEYNGVFPAIFRDCVNLTNLTHCFFGQITNNKAVIWDDLITFDPDIFKNCRNLLIITKLFAIDHIGSPNLEPDRMSKIPRNTLKSRTPKFKNIELSQMLRDCVNFIWCDNMFAGSMIEHLGSDPHYFKNCRRLTNADLIFSQMLSLEDTITQPFKGIENQITTLNHCFAYSHVDVDLQKFFETPYPKLTNIGNCFYKNYKVHGTVESDLLKGCPNVTNVSYMFNYCPFITYLKKKNDGKGFFDWIPKCGEAIQMFAQTCKPWEDSPSFIKLRTYDDLVEIVDRRKYGVIESNFFSQSGTNSIVNIPQILHFTGFVVFGDKLFENCHKLENAGSAFEYSYGAYYIGHGIFKNCEKLVNASNCFANGNYKDKNKLYDTTNKIFTILNRSISYSYDFNQPPIGDGNNCNRTDTYLFGPKERPESWFKGCASLKDVSYCFYLNAHWEWVIPGDIFADCPKIDYIVNVFAGNLRALPAIPYNLLKACYKTITVEGGVNGCFDNLGYQYINAQDKAEFPWRNIKYVSKNYGPLWPYVDNSDTRPRDGFLSKTKPASEYLQKNGGPNAGAGEYIGMIYGSYRQSAGLNGVDIKWAGQAPNT